MLETAPVEGDFQTRKFVAPDTPFSGAGLRRVECLIAKLLQIEPLPFA
jgi:hypothetical protein